jgi:hypothetical protein
MIVEFFSSPILVNHYAMRKKMKNWQGDRRRDTYEAGNGEEWHAEWQRNQENVQYSIFNIQYSMAISFHGCLAIIIEH